MVDILDEVLNEEKDIRRLQIFRKILPIIIVATILIALGIGGYNWFLAAKTKQHQELGDLFIQSFSKKYKDKNLTTDILEELKSKKESKLFELAALKMIGEQIGEEKATEAMKSLENIVESKDYSELTKSYARILYFTLVLDVETLNNDQENKVREYFQFFSKENQVFYATATLLKSLFYLKNKQPDMARQYAMELLKLARASAVLKDQARAVLASIERLAAIPATMKITGNH